MLTEESLTTVGHQIQFGKLFFFVFEGWRPQQQRGPLHTGSTRWSVRRRLVLTRPEVSFFFFSSLMTFISSIEAYFRSLEAGSFDVGPLVRNWLAIGPLSA